MQTDRQANLAKSLSNKIATEADDHFSKMHNKSNKTNCCKPSMKGMDSNQYKHMLTANNFTYDNEIDSSERINSIINSIDRAPKLIVEVKYFFT